MEVRLVHFTKAFLLIKVTLLPMVTEVRLAQLAQVYSPIDVTLLGMEMEVKLVQPEKAL